MHQTNLLIVHPIASYMQRCYRNDTFSNTSILEASIRIIVIVAVNGPIALIAYNCDASRCHTFKWKIHIHKGRINKCALASIWVYSNIVLYTMHSKAYTHTHTHRRTFIHLFTIQSLLANSKYYLFELACCGRILVGKSQLCIHAHRSNKNSKQTGWIPMGERVRVLVRACVSLHAFVLVWHVYWT